MSKTLAQVMDKLATVYSPEVLEGVDDELNAVLEPGIFEAFYDVYNKVIEVLDAVDGVALGDEDISVALQRTLELRDLVTL